MFRGIIDEQRGKLWWWKREKEEIDKEPDIEARPLDFRHQLKSTTTTKEVPDDDDIYLSLRVRRSTSASFSFASDSLVTYSVYVPRSSTYSN